MQKIRKDCYKVDANFICIKRYNQKANNKFTNFKQTSNCLF